MIPKKDRINKIKNDIPVAAFWWLVQFLCQFCCISEETCHIDDVELQYIPPSPFDR
jgi:hypothetical protein